jgi:hypothetical protein
VGKGWVHKKNKILPYAIGRCGAGAEHQNQAAGLFLAGMDRIELF